MRKKLIVTSVLLSVLLIALCALAIFLHIQPRFPDNTVIFKTDVSNMFLWDAVPAVQQTIDSYTVTVKAGDEQVTFSKDDLSMALDEAALEQLAVALEKGNTNVDLSSAVTMSDEVIREWIETNIPEDRLEPVDARLVWNPENCLFELTGGVVGEYNDIEIACQMAADSFLKMETAITLTEEDYRVEYTDPEQIAAEQEALEYANSLVLRELTYQYYMRTGEYTPEVITPEMIGSWLIIGEDGLSLTWDEDAVLTYSETMAETYSFQGEGYFLTHDGRKMDLTVEVPVNLVDAQALYEDILESLNNAESGEREVPYSEQNKCWNYDGTYIEISIEQQKLYGFVDGELLIETDIVTGCQHCNHDSITGVYDVMNHGRNIKLQDKDEYFVYYWMAIKLPYGLHDADGWRTEYGGEIYKVDGSGGCFNVPRKVMAQVYETFKDGDPVIIYDETYLIVE